MKRRPLDLRDADAVIAEIRRLHADGYTMLGKWNLSQMCDHIRATLRLGLDGGPKRLPKVVRLLVTGPLVRRTIRTRKMASGVPAPKDLVPTRPIGPDDPAAIDSCIATLEEARDAAGPLPPHPLADMTADEWRQLNWVHASHHLGFLVPNEPPATGRAAEPASAAGAP